MVEREVEGDVGEVLDGDGARGGGRRVVPSSPVVPFVMLSIYFEVWIVVEEVEIDATVAGASQRKGTPATAVGE